MNRRNKDLQIFHKALAIFLAAVGLSLLLVVTQTMQPNFRIIVSSFDEKIVLPTLHWIISNLGFTNTIHSVRAHINIGTAASIITFGIACSAFGSFALAVLNVFSARFILMHRHYRCIFFVSCINCLCGPLGLLVGLNTLAALKHPRVIRKFMLPSENSIHKPKLPSVTPEQETLLEIVRMPNPFHVGLVLTYYDENLNKQRTVWINGWFGVSVPISITATVTSQSPYFLPFLPTSGPFIVKRKTAVQIEEMACTAQKFLGNNKMPYSFVPGVFDGVWPLFVNGGHTSNNIVASLLHWSNAIVDLETQYKDIEPWLFAPGANPKNMRNIMPSEWFQR